MARNNGRKGDMERFKQIRKATKKRWKRNKKCKKELERGLPQALKNQVSMPRAGPEDEHKPKNAEMEQLNDEHKPENAEMEQLNDEHKPENAEMEQLNPKNEREEPDTRVPILHSGVIKEIAPSEVVRSRKWLGSGTFGSCYLAHYRGIMVAVKEFKALATNQTEPQAELLKQDVIYEAAVISRLGDHPGLPLLFGISTQSKPYRLIMQFHGENNESLTLWRSLKKFTLPANSWYLIMKQITLALQRVHEVGFLHNDLKSNNVLLEKRGDSYNPVIIDFGKARKISNPKSLKKLSKAKQKEYRKKYPHIVPEIVRGTHRQRIASDIYSLGKMFSDAIELFPDAKPDVIQHVRQAMADDPDKRQPLSVLFDILTVAARR